MRTIMDGFLAGVGCGRIAVSGEILADKESYREVPIKSAVYIVKRGRSPLDPALIVADLPNCPLFRTRIYPTAEPFDRLSLFL
jgi:hypothetical protein